MGGGKLVAIHAGKYYKTTDGLALGPGPFVRALEYAADIKATVVGKPSPVFFLAAAGSDASQAAMIGDVSMTGGYRSNPSMLSHLYSLFKTWLEIITSSTSPANK